MSTVDAIMSEIHQLSAEEQARLLRELSREILAKRFRERAERSNGPLPFSDAELDQIVHEARRETLRAHDL